MNKLLKGAIATAAAALLLTGGAGSLAYWNAQTTVGGGTITAGNLTLANSGTAAWAANGTAITLNTFKVVPGDVLTLTQDVTVTATGNNLVGTLSVDSGELSGALATFLNKNATISVVGSPAGVTCAAGTTCTITAGAAGVSAQTLTVRVTINFPKSGVAGDENGARTQTATLSGLTIKLDQNH
jgi:alternate signal-mediated exported protein